MKQQRIKGGITIDKDPAIEANNEEIIMENGDMEILSLKCEKGIGKPEHGVQKVLYNMTRIWERLKLLATSQESEGMNTLIQLYGIIPVCRVLRYSKQVCTKMSHMDLRALVSVLKEVIPLLEEMNAIKIILALTTDRPLLHESEFKIPDFEDLEELSAMQLTKCQETVNFLLSRVFNLLKTILEDTEMKELLISGSLVHTDRFSSSLEYLNAAASLASDYASYFSLKCRIGREMLSKL